jgi:transposase
MSKHSYSGVTSTASACHAWFGYPADSPFQLCFDQGSDPADHPLRTIQALVNPILVALSPRFEAMCSHMGRPSIPPERLLRALLLQVLYTIRSECQLMEQLDCNLLFRWFVGLNPDDAIWVPTLFTKNRARLETGNIADAFLGAVLTAADARGLLSHEHTSRSMGRYWRPGRATRVFGPKTIPRRPRRTAIPRTRR